jgi:PAS domain S-box-containing protein
MIGSGSTVANMTKPEREDEIRLRHAAILESSDDAIIGKTLHGVISAWNPAAQRMFGYTEQEALGQPITIIIPPELQHEETEILRRLRAGERIEHFETRRISKTGKIIKVSLTISPIRDANGAIIGTFKIARDITARERAAQLQKKSEEKFEKLFRVSPLAITLISAKDDRYVDVNETFERLTGWKHDEVIGKTPDELGMWSASSPRADFVKKLLAGETMRNLRVELRMKSGEIRTSLGSAELLEIAGEQCILTVATDITELQRAEQALRESEERFRLAIHAGRMYAFDWDVVRDVIVRSEESRQLFGFNEEPMGITKRGFLARVHPDDRPKFMDSIAECTPEHPHNQISYRLLSSDGAVLWLERTGLVFFDERGKMVRMTGIVADITERRQADEALSMLSQRLIEAQEQERSRIARELHDDVNQRIALAAISLDVIRNSGASAEELREGIEEVRARLLELGTDVQTLSHRLYSPKLEQLGLNKAAESFCREFSQQHGVKIDFSSKDVPRDLPAEIGLCLFRILQESLQNAAKHSGSHDLRVSLTARSDNLQLTVSDSGKGFDPDETLKAEGIGLASMKERVKLVDGELSIRTERGHGTTVFARVPLGATIKAATAD